MSPSKNTKEHIEFVRKQLISCEIARDSLPYHKKFEEFYSQYSKSGLPKLSKNDYWRLLDNAGKKGSVKQPNRIKLPVVRVTPEEKLEIVRILPDSAGARDRLPYTTEFDQLYKNFKQHTGRNLTKNEFWRLVLRTTKASRKPKPIVVNPNSGLNNRLNKRLNNRLNNGLSESLLKDLQRMNPWWSGNRTHKIPTSKRQTYQFLFESVLKGRYPIVALRGPRQVGKTTIQRQMIQDLLNEKHVLSPKQILRIQFDDLKSLALDDPIVTIIDWFEENVVQDTFNNSTHNGRSIYIFLDEIQDVDNWSAQLKHIVDHEECRIFITGSSSLRIIKEKESLAGRVHWNEINTLGLSEISQFRHAGSLNSYTTEVEVTKFRDKEFWTDFKAWSCYESALLEEIYQIFCDFGGYPFCHTGDSISWQEADEHLCDTVVARTIDHDLSVSFNSEYGKKMGMMSSTLLSNVFRIFSKYSGIAVNLTTLQRELSASFSEQLTHTQIRMILDFFEHSMLIKVVKPFEHRLKNPREEVKICLCDHAIRKAWLKEDIPLYGMNVNTDLAGHVVEGIIGSFLKSIKGVGVSYQPEVQQNRNGNNKKEIDFILEVGDRPIPIEVKYQENPDINTGIKQFLEKKAYNASFGLVITKNEIPLDSFGNPDIIPISAKKFLLLK